MTTGLARQKTTRMPTWTRSTTMTTGTRPAAGRPRATAPKCSSTRAAPARADGGPARAGRAWRSLAATRRALVSGTTATAIPDLAAGARAVPHAGGPDGPPGLGGPPRRRPRWRTARDGVTDGRRAGPAGPAGQARHRHRGRRRAGPDHRARGDLAQRRRGLARERRDREAGGRGRLPEPGCRVGPRAGQLRLCQGHQPDPLGLRPADQRRQSRLPGLRHRQDGP